MKGAIIGDIIGSIYEFDNYKGEPNDFELFTLINFYTDDTICTCGIAKTLLEKDKPSAIDYAKNLWNFCNKYSKESYGGYFRRWLKQNPPKPYGSYGNGAAMRISAIPYFYKDNFKEMLKQTNAATLISHNHKESLKGAKAVSSAIWYLLNGATKEDIRKLANKLYELPPVKKIKFNETCQGTVPICFSILLESNSFEEAMRKAVWVGGDTDTICAIVGSMAEPLFGIPEEIEEKMWEYLNEDIKNIIKDFEWRTR
jgi:ADP-ribosylglycohydrolase